MFLRNRLDISSALLDTNRSTRSCCPQSSTYNPSSNLRKAVSGWPGIAIAVAWSLVVCTLMWCFKEL